MNSLKSSARCRRSRTKNNHKSNSEETKNNNNNNITKWPHSNKIFVRVFYKMFIFHFHFNFFSFFFCLLHSITKVGKKQVLFIHEFSLFNECLHYSPFHFSINTNSATEIDSFFVHTQIATREIKQQRIYTMKPPHQKKKHTQNNIFNGNCWLLKVFKRIERSFGIFIGCFLAIVHFFFIGFLFSFISRCFAFCVRFFFLLLLLLFLLHLALAVWWNLFRSFMIRF